MKNKNAKTDEVPVPLNSMDSIDLHGTTNNSVTSFKHL